MSTNSSLEERLAAVEAAIAELQKQGVTPQATNNWLQQITGSFKDEPAFEELKNNKLELIVRASMVQLSSLSLVQ